VMRDKRTQHGAVAEITISHVVKLAGMQGLEGLDDYASAMFSLVFYLPAILLWLATILAGVALGWELRRLAARVLFPAKKAASLLVVSS